LGICASYCRVVQLMLKSWICSADFCWIGWIGLLWCNQKNTWLPPRQRFPIWQRTVGSRAVSGSVAPTVTSHCRRTPDHSDSEMLRDVC
jgi:hypothetical protein